MATKFHIFNPEHDSALAMETGIYTPKPQIQQFAKDLSTLPLWYSDEEDKVIVSRGCPCGCPQKPNPCGCPQKSNPCGCPQKPNPCGCPQDSASEDWINSVKNIIPNIRERIVTIDDYKHFKSNKSLLPWGIDNTVCKLTNTTHIDDEIVADVIKRTKIFSSREQTQDALTCLKNEGLYSGFVSQKVASIEDLRKINNQFGKIVVKAPWSSSGRGVLFIDTLDEKEEKRIQKIIDSQGFIMAESFFEKEIDFAIEFEYIDNKWQFGGYSLFSTDEHGVYKQNILATDDYLKTEICKHADSNKLDNIIDFYCNYFQDRKDNLKGNKIIGVDMMAGNGQIHPCVEINVRYTMGIVARKLYDKYIETGKIGYYSIIRLNNSEELKNWELKQKETFPSTITKGKITKGFVALTPIASKTVFQAFVVVEG